MKYSALALVVMIAGLAGCSSDREPLARKAGHAAYKVAQESKKAAKAAGHELHVAGKEAHEGWKDAKRESQSKKQPDRP